MRFIYPESKCKNVTANIGELGEKSKQDVAIELINNLSDFLDSEQ